LRNFSLVDGECLLKHDLENDEAEEQVDACPELSFLSSSKFPMEDEFFDFFEFPVVKRELRKFASFPPGEIGCFTFFRLR
jgi:hypothetical protein